MSEPFIAEVRIFGFNFAPRGWATCDGQTLSIAQNTALFSLIGTFYGGNGTTTFALPDLRGRAPLHIGGAQPGPGLSIYNLGEQDGEENVTLVITQMPAHTHTANASSAPALTKTPAPTTALARTRGGNAYESTTPTPDTPLNPQTLSVAGNSQAHNNMQPYLTLNFCIALEGIYPARG